MYIFVYIHISHWLANHDIFWERYALPTIVVGCITAVKTKVPSQLLTHGAPMKNERRR